MLTRRRFLAISAAVAAGPAWAERHSWQGRALGADVSLTIHGPRPVAASAVEQLRRILAEVEKLFSLYDESATLVQLNGKGHLLSPDPRFVALMQAADHAHHLTGGLFDPTVQPLWRALADGGDIAGGQRAVGWHRVAFNRHRIDLAAGQALTFNGIAQGFATDLIADELKAHGLTDTLINIGEYRALGGPWRLAISDPAHGELGMRTLRNRAIATSSPAAMMLGAQTHILHPAARPCWSTVSVEAETATLADSLSTALCLAPRDQVAAMRDADGVNRITLVDFDGNLTSL